MQANREFIARVLNRDDRTRIEISFGYPVRDDPGERGTARVVILSQRKIE